MRTAAEVIALAEADEAAKLARLEWEMIPNEYRNLVRPPAWEPVGRTPKPSNIVAQSAFGIDWWREDAWKNLGR